MPAGLLMGAAGAAEGLETLLARRLREAQFAELQRAAQEREQFQTRQLDETTRLREAQQEETARMHRETERVRGDAEKRQRLTLRLQSLEPGSTVDQAERDYLTGEGLSPSSFSEVYTDPATRHPLGPHAPGGTGGVYGPPDSAFQGPDEKQAPGPSMFRYQGRTADRLRQEGIASQEETAALNRQNQLTMAQLAAATRLQTAAMGGSNQSDPPVTITAPDGAQVQVPRSVYYSGPEATRDWVMRYRQGGIQGTQTGTSRDQARMSETSLESLSTLEGLYNKGASGFIGPLAGRLTNAKRVLPGFQVSPIEAAFAAETATLKNQIIKAITGAQMSEPEASRIMQQIPDITDKPEVWLQKAASTRRNLLSLQSGVLTPHAGTGGMAMPRSNAAGAPRQAPGQVPQPQRTGATSRYKILSVQ